MHTIRYEDANTENSQTLSVDKYKYLLRYWSIRNIQIPHYQPEESISQQTFVSSVFI